MDFVKELRWRGMLHDIMPGTEEQLEKEQTSAEVILLTAQARIQYLTGNTIYSNENR